MVSKQTILLERIAHELERIADALTKLEAREAAEVEAVAMVDEMLRADPDAT